MTAAERIHLKLNVAEEKFKIIFPLPCWHLSPVKVGMQLQTFFTHWPPFSQGGLHIAEKQTFVLVKSDLVSGDSLFVG
jgi:hypothetical protein